jgi:hypothetical protein
MRRTRCCHSRQHQSRYILRCEKHWTALIGPRCCSLYIPCESFRRKHWRPQCFNVTQSPFRRDVRCDLLTKRRHGFNWFDRRGTEGVGFIRALRTLLTNNLPKILPDLTCIIRTRFQELHSGHPVIDGTVLLYSYLPLALMRWTGKKQSDVYHMTVKLVVLSNAVSFFGKDLGMFTNKTHHTPFETHINPLQQRMNSL